MKGYSLSIRNFLRTLYLSVEEWWVDVTPHKMNRYTKVSGGRSVRKGFNIFTWRKQPWSGRPPDYRGFTIIIGHTRIGNTPLDEWSAQFWDLNLIRHSTKFIYLFIYFFFWQRLSRCAVTNLYNVFYSVNTQLNITTVLLYIHPGHIMVTCFDRKRSSWGNWEYFKFQ